MSTTQDAITQPERVAWARYIWVAPLAVVASVAANVLVRTAAKALFAVPDEFMPFSPGTFIAFTTVGVTGAVLVFALVGWLSKRPFTTYNWIAGVVLVLSWLPDIGLLVARPFPGITAAGVGTLMLMHLVAAGITIWLLNTQARAK
jgi:hypothetical protein